MADKTMQQDLTLIVSDIFQQAFVLFHDPRAKHWRGEWHEWFVYDPGEAVELEPGEAFVSLLRTRNQKPSGATASEFWSPLTPLDLTEHEVSLVCGSLFTLTEGAGISVEPTNGKIEITVKPEQLEAVPSSESYYVRLIDSAGRPSTPIRGTMLFRQP